MIQLGRLIQFIYDLNPQKNIVRQTFYNYLNLFGLQKLTLIELNNFFAYALTFPFWIQNRVELTKEIQKLLKSYAASSGEELNFDEIDWPQDLQNFELTFFKDLADVVSRHLERTLTSQEKYRLIQDQEKRIIALVLGEDRSLRVTSFDKKVVIRRGLLEPLRTNVSVFYNPDLSLNTQKVHLLEIAPYVLGRIALEPSDSYLIRGYIFQKHLEFTGKSLSEEPHLFYPLKRLEQFFISREFDPFYKQALEIMQTAIEELEIGSSEASLWAQKSLTKAEEIFEKVYMGDQRYYELLSQLRRSLRPSYKQPPIVEVKEWESSSEIQELRLD